MDTTKALRKEAVAAAGGHRVGVYRNSCFLCYFAESVLIWYVAAVLTTQTSALRVAAIVGQSSSKMFGSDVGCRSVLRI